MPVLTPLAARMLAASGSSRPSAEAVPPEVEQEILSRLASQSGQAIESLFTALDTPGAIARGVLAGDPASGFSFDPQRRVTGSELLDSYGINAPPGSLGGWGPGLAGFAAEVALDPLNLFSFGLGAAGKAARAAQAADILKYAPKAAMRQLGGSASDIARQAASTRTGRSVLNALTREGVPLTRSTLDIRPLIGERVARYRTTLDDVIQATPRRDRGEAIRQLEDYLSPRGMTIDDVRNKRLGSVFGFGLPGMEQKTFSPFSNATNEALLDAADYLGQAARWNPVTRTLSSFVDQRVGGETKMADQIEAMKNFAARQAATNRGSAMATIHGQMLNDVELTPRGKALLGADTFFSPEGNDVVTRFANGKPTANDLDILAESKGLENYLTNWRVYHPVALARQKRLGLRVNEYADEYGNLYSPRKAYELDYGDASRGTGQAANRATMESMYSRTLPGTPGGDIDYREISLLPNVRAYALDKTAANPFTDRQIADEIGDYILAKHGVMMHPDKTLTIARAMQGMNKDLPAGVAVFGEHPVNAQMRYMVNAEQRIAAGQSVMRSLAEHARFGDYTQQPGVKMRSLQEVLATHSQALGFEPGRYGKPRKVVADNLKELLAKRAGVSPDKIKLSQFHIPESAADRLVRIQDFYNAPKAQEEVGNMFASFQNLFKGFVLAWPSRYVRDAYSNLASIWLETGDAPGAVTGMWAASKILAGKHDEAIKYLAQIPRYRRYVDAAGNIDTQRLLSEFNRDVGGNRVLSGLATSDLLTSNRTGDIGQFVPGSTPTTISGGLRQLIPTTANPVRQASDFFQIKGVTNTFETRNPLLNAGQEIGDTVDSIARLGGFLSLMKHGVGPQQAAARMKNALVDYSSLTPFERHWMKNIFLWWSYQSRIGKYAVQSLVENPGGRYAQMIRAINNLQRPGEGGGYIPTALRQQVAVRLPDYLQFNPGTTTYLKNIDLPGLDVLNVFQPAPAGQYLPINIQRTMMELLNQSNPIAKTVGEIAFDTDLYSKRPLSEARTSVDKIYQRLTGSPNNVDPITKAVIQNTPGLTRLLSLGGTLADQNIENPLYRALKILVNEISGLKLQDVDPEYELLDARNKISGVIGPYQNTSTVRHIPAEKLPSLPPEVALYNAVDKQLQKKLTEFYKKKRAAKEFQKQAAGVAP